MAFLKVGKLCFQKSRTGILVISLLSFIALSCSTQTGLPSQQFSIIVEDPNRIRFSGKGAGAGMMLMSTLGPTGIAVGIAIDEGIGKEIDERAKAGQVNIERILQEQLAKELAKTSIKYPPKTEIVIQRYGFLSSSENRDNVLPQLHLVIISDGQKRTLKYPEDYKEVASNPPSAPLEHVKSDAEVIEELLNKTAHFLVGEMISLY